MKRAAGAALLLTCLALSACGHSSDSGAPRPETAGSPKTGAEPSWGCAIRSMAFTDYGPDARGEPTRDAALASYREAGDRVVYSRGGPHEADKWLLVDDAGHIHAALELLHNKGGWLVSAAEKCST